jgi:hypothetical protein
MRVNVKVRANIKTGHIKNRYKAGRNKALDRLGSFTRQRAKEQFLNPRPDRKPTWRRVGEREGIPVVEVTFRPPTPGRITSWKTGKGRSAKGFLKSSIRYERDDRRGSVVIGPAENTVWLNKIQEFGGQRPVAFRYLARHPQTEINGHRVPGGMGAGGRSAGRDARGRFRKASGGAVYIVKRVDAQLGRKGKLPAHSVEQGKVKPARYMATAIKKMMPKIPPSFRGLISGP